MSNNLNKIIAEFNIESEKILDDSSNFGEGHINSTYLLNFSSGKYILQRINNDIFKNVENLMSNILLVTDHIGKKVISRGGNPERETIKFIMTKSGKPYVMGDDGSYFRLYKFIDDVDVYQMVENEEQFYSAAKAFGRFQNDLSDFKADKLYETIPNFHDTKKRFENLKAAIEADVVGRKKDVLGDIEFALLREKETNIVVEAIKNGEIPLRVTHNDTKLNNVLFKKGRNEALCVIDLDTVMPGSLLYDFGDSIRFGASSAVEDETDLDKVYCDLELFAAFTKGFLEEVGKNMTMKEIELLAFSAKLMTYECGIRFLTDYLSGDTYFRIHKPSHNLDRARNQFKLVADMESKMNKMNECVTTLMQKL